MIPEGLLTSSGDISLSLQISGIDPVFPTWPSSKTGPVAGVDDLEHPSLCLDAPLVSAKLNSRSQEHLVLY